VFAAIVLLLICFVLKEEKNAVAKKAVFSSCYML